MATLTRRENAMRGLTLRLAVALAAWPHAGAGSDLKSVPPRDRFTILAQRVVELVNREDIDGLEKLFSPSLQKALPSDRVGALATRVVRGRGKLLEVGPPRITGLTARFAVTAERGEWEMRITLDSEARISALYITDPVPPIRVPDRNATPMELPFRGQWKVLWGGKTEEDNYHVATRNQRRAFDFRLPDVEGKAHRGDGKRNDNFPTYGQPVVAVGPGTVATAVDGVPDNRPGTVNPYTTSGNMVIIKHAEFEYSVYFHLQPGSLTVRAGDAVKTGQELGRCGNSGNTSAPHLHFHLMNTAVPQDATGFPAVFRNVRVTRDGQTRIESEYSPVRGDLVESAHDAP